MENLDMVIFWSVVLARFFVPLLIPKYPLPAIIAALIIDGVDQTIFQQFTSLDLSGYQSYDKALDIYYLTIAYLSTLRNWTNPYALKVAKFLWYYRLVGVALFELTYTGEGARWLLLIFPNVFEYFFIFYETVRLRWDPAKMTRRAVLLAAAAIWIFIKLPQEYWIHIAQNDTTDFLKERIYGVPLDTGLVEMVTSNWVITGWFVGMIMIAVGALIYLTTKLPPFDHGWRVSAESGEIDMLEEEANVRKSVLDFINPASIEKIVLISLILIIFANIIPGLDATAVQITVGTAIVIFTNILVSHFIFARGGHWKNIFREFAVMGLINLVIILIYESLLGSNDGGLNLQVGIFFSILLTMIVTLYDRYSYMRKLRDEMVDMVREY